MSSESIKEEIKKYVQAIETNYNETIKNLKIKIEEADKKFKKHRNQNVPDIIQKGDLEFLFVDSIEETRKEIMKRRLRNEVNMRKKFGLSEKDGNDAKEFEESLIKLANFNNGKVKVSDFTSVDKFNLLDLFVNNEKTMLKIYETLFPNKHIIGNQ